MPTTTTVITAVAAAAPADTLAAALEADALALLDEHGEHYARYGVVPLQGGAEACVVTVCIGGSDGCVARLHVTAAGVSLSFGVNEDGARQLQQLLGAAAGKIAAVNAVRAAQRQAEGGAL